MGKKKSQRKAAPATASSIEEASASVQSTPPPLVDVNIAGPTESVDLESGATGSMPMNDGVEPNSETIQDGSNDFEDRAWNPSFDEIVFKDEGESPPEATGSNVEQIVLKDAEGANGKREATSGTVSPQRVASRAVNSSTSPLKTPTKLDKGEDHTEFSDVIWSPETTPRAARSSAKTVSEDGVADLPKASRFSRILGSPRYSKLEKSPSQELASSDQKSPPSLKQKRSATVVPLASDEEQGLNEEETIGDEDVTSATAPATLSSDEDLSGRMAALSPRSALLKSNLCSRRSVLACLFLFILSLIIARGVGKSSNSSLSAQTPEDRLNPIKQAADEHVKNLNAALAGRPGPVIISTVGSNGEGLKAVQLVLNALGMRIPDKVAFKGLTVNTRNGTVVKAGFRRVLASSLNPERRMQFDERSVADSSALMEWHIGRAFVATYVNATLKAIPEDQRKDRWALAHERAGYLLPYFKSIFGAENFVFVHVVSNGMSLASKVYEEFRHMCDFLRYSDFCKNTSENKLMFWAQVTKDAFQWSKSRLDVDRYVAIRAEDFTQGNKQCIGRVAKALGLKFTDEELEAAAAIGLKSVDQIEGGDDSTLRDVQGEVENLPAVKKELEFWGYDVADPSKMTPCEKMSWV